MYCGKCGSLNEESVSFCKNCGAVINQAAEKIDPSDSSNNGSAPATSTKKTKVDMIVSFIKKKWMIVVPAVVVIALILLNINTIILKAAPSYTIKNAVENAISDIEKRADKSQLKIFDLLFESFENGTVGSEITYNDDYGTEFFGNIEILADSKNKNYGFLTSINANGEEFNFEAYMNSKRIALKAPLIDDEFYGFAYDGFSEDIKPFAQIAGLDDQTVDMITNIVDSINTSMNEGYKDIYKEYDKILRRFFKNLEPDPSKTEITVNDKTIKCTEVKYIITEEMLDKLLTDLYDLYSKDEQMKSIVMSSLRLQYSNYGMSDDDIEAYYNEMLIEYENALNTFKDEYSGTIKVSFYISGRNELLQIGIQADPEINDEKANIEIAAIFGKDPVKDDIGFRINILDPYGEEIKLNLSLESSSDTGEFTEHIKFDFNDGYSTERYSMKSEWNEESGDLILELDDGYVVTKIDGNLYIDMDSFKLELNDLIKNEYDNSNLDIVISTKKIADIPDPDYINIDKWDSDLINKITNAFGYFNY